MRKVNDKFSELFKFKKVGNCNCQRKFVSIKSSVKHETICETVYYIWLLKFLLRCILTLVLKEANSKLYSHLRVWRHILCRSIPFISVSSQSTIMICCQTSKVSKHRILKHLISWTWTPPLLSHHEVPWPQESSLIITTKISINNINNTFNKLINGMIKDCNIVNIRPTWLGVSPSVFLFCMSTKNPPVLWIYWVVDGLQTPL